MQNEFINIAAHELRAPIQPILGLAEVLRDEKRQQENREQENVENKDDLLNDIIRNAKRLQRLTENILDITKIENNSIELNNEEFILSTIVLETFTDFANQLSREQKVETLVNVSSRVQKVTKCYRNDMPILNVELYYYSCYLKVVLYY